MKPYTYLIGWPEHNTWYYGVRYANGCNPSDLWNPYTTSSKHVDAFVAEHGAPSVREIRRTFKNTIQARVWEERVLKRMKVVGNDRWLNKHDSMSPPIQSGETHHAKQIEYRKNHPMKRPEARMRQHNNWLGNKNPMTNPDVVAKKVAKTSGDTHHMKRPEISNKVSGKNNYIYKDPEALLKRRIQFIEMNKLRLGTHYRKIGCQYCGREIGATTHKKHETHCQTNLTSSVGNTDKTVYNNLVGSI